MTRRGGSSMYFAYGEEETDYLKKKDKRMAEVIDRIGHVERKVDTDLFSAVVHHIVGQQISTKAQETIWQRMLSALGEVNAETVLAAGVSKLQSLGMTFRKAEYITDFAEKVHTGAFDLEGIWQKSDEEAIRELSSLKGIGCGGLGEASVDFGCRAHIPVVAHAQRVVGIYLEIVAQHAIERLLLVALQSLEGVDPQPGACELVGVVKLAAALVIAVVGLAEEVAFALTVVPADVLACRAIAGLLIYGAALYAQPIALTAACLDLDHRRHIRRIAGARRGYQFDVLYIFRLEPLQLAVVAHQPAIDVEDRGASAEYGIFAFLARQARYERQYVVGCAQLLQIRALDGGLHALGAHGHYGAACFDLYAFQFVGFLCERDMVLACSCKR